MMQQIIGWRLLRGPNISFSDCFIHHYLFQSSLPLSPPAHMQLTFLRKNSYLNRKLDVFFSPLDVDVNPKEFSGTHLWVLFIERARDILLRRRVEGGSRGLEMHRFLLEALRLEDTSVGFCCGKISSSWNFS